jgi:uncharacterized surface protein with fasciclin (FAS1) repeats
MKISIVFAGLVILALGATQAQTNQPKPVSQTIVDIINKGTHFTKLAAALKSTGLDKILAGKGPYTVFAPTNAAFDKIPKATMTQVLTNKDLLTKILLYHVLPGKFSSAELIKRQTIKSAEGTTLNVTNVKNVLRVNKSRMVKTGVEATNGEIYVIGLLLVPKK